ncbi:MAG: alpha-L-fucosidase [Planctomycetota bacterium]|jgi:alpha-L-fucosidase
MLSRLRRSALATFLCLNLIPSLTAADQAEAVDPTVIVESDYDWWREARFGIFMHWAPSSLLEMPNGSWRRKGNDMNKGRNETQDTPPQAITDGSYRKILEQPARTRKAPFEIFDNLHHIFNPSEFDADEWADTFAASGAGYIVFTTKHHDGFCMFDSKHTDYDIMNTPFGRDIAKELSAACHKRGIKVIWYYSKADWYDPRYDVANPQPYEDYLYNQVEELMTNYGPVAGIWWDGGLIKVNARRVMDMIRKHQPGAISNGRLHGQGDGGKIPGLTFSTPEQRLGAFKNDWPWESCVTIFPHDSWYWNGGKGYRSVDSCLRLLANCAVGDGNLLLDFGPPPSGKMLPKIDALYRGIGDWLAVHREAVMGTRGGPYKPGVWGGSTRQGNHIYLHIMQEWTSGTLHLPKLQATITGAELMANPDAPLSVEQTADGIIVNLPAEHHHAANTVIKLTVAEDALGMPLVETMPVR